MSFLSRIKGLFGVSFGTPGAATFVTAREWALGIDSASPTGMTAPYAQHPSVCIAIRTIAEDAASVDWEIYTDSSSDDDTEVEEHPLLDLWDKPNATMTGSDLWVGSYTYFKLYGECLWYYPGLRVGVTNGAEANRRSTGTIELLNPALVTVKVTEAGIAYTLRVNGQDVELDPDYLTHFKRFNPYNPYRGLSELTSLAMELNVDWAASSWNAAFFGDQNGIPTGLLKPTVGAILPSDDREKYMAQWNSRHSKQRGVGILPPGWDWIAAGGAPKDMEFGAMREFSREQILAVYGVPPFMAGVLDKANYANAREQRATYWNGTITRMLYYFQGVINNDFLPKVGIEGIKCYPDFESVKALTEDLETKGRIASSLFQIGFTKRMLNDRLDLGMDVDDLEDADVGYLPMNMLPVSMMEEAHTPVAPVVATPDPNMDPNEEPDDSNAAAKFYRKAQAASNEGRRANVWRAIASATRDIETRFAKAIRRHFQEIEDEVLTVMNSLKGWNLVHGVEKATESSLFDLQYAKGKLMKLTMPLHAAAIDRGGTGVMAEVNATDPFDVLSPNVSAKLAELTRKITRIDDTVERQLRESLVEGLKAGESITQLAKRVSDVMDASRSRAETIARTETNNAFSSGRVEGARQAGVSKMEWISARDNFVRDTHAPGTGVDGEVRGLDEPFSNGCRWPGDSQGAAAEVINCRCTVVPVIGDPIE
jgi:HK97 family phage portal protein